MASEGSELQNAVYIFFIKHSIHVKGQINCSAPTKSTLFSYAGKRTVKDLQDFWN